MLLTAKNLAGYSLPAGEPFLLGVRVCDDTTDAPIDMTSRRLVLSFYDGSRAAVAQIQGEYLSDSGGPYFRFARDGRFSDGLFGQTLQVELSERLLDGRMVLATGPLTISPSSGGITSWGSVIGRAETFVTIYLDPNGIPVVWDQKVRPYAAASAPPPTLNALSLSGTLEAGKASSGSIIGATDGSSLAENVSGLTISSGARTYAWDGTGSAGTVANALVETLAGAIGSPRTTPLTIAAAPVTPTVSITDLVTKPEGNSGVTQYVFTITRSSTVGATSVPWTFGAGSTSPDDFAGGYPTGGSVVLADGVASGTIVINVAGDLMVEPNENFSIMIVPPSGYAAGTVMTGAGSITNDDTLVPASFTVTQLPTANRVYQRDSETGGLGSGLGRVTHQVNVTSAGAIYVRTRDKATDAIVQPSKLVASSVATGAQTLQLDLPARLGQQLVDLSGDGTTWTAGTTPISVGEVLFVWGQSLVEFALRRNGGDTLATLGVGTGNTYAYATIATGETAAWGPVADGQTNDGAAIAEFGARRAAAIGCDVGVVGHAASGQAIVEFRASTANGAKMIANAQGSGGKWAATLIIHGHSDIRYAPPIAAYKRSVKAIQARLETENSFGGTRRVMMMTTPSNNNGFWGRPINNNRIRRAGVELAAENAGWISVTAPDTETRDGVHESQRGGVAMGQAAARALSSNATGPAPVSAARTAAQTVRVTFDKAVVGTGNWWENAKVFSRGSVLNIWPVSGGAINGADVTLTLANDPGPGQALDVWFGLAQDNTNGPQTRMLRDGTSDLGIGAGRPFAPNVTAIVAAAINNGGAINVPPGGNQPGVANYDLTMTNPVYSAELLAGFGPVLSGGRGTATGPGGTSLTQEIFFRVPPTSGSYQIIATWPGNVLAVANNKIFFGYDRASGFSFIEGATTLVPGQICHIAATVDIDAGCAVYLARDLTGTPVVTRELFDANKPTSTVYAGDLNIRHNQSGNFPFNDSVWHHALWDGARYTSLADYTSRRPTAPYAGTEAGLLALHRLNSSGADLVLDRVTP